MANAIAVIEIRASESIMTGGQSNSHTRTCSKMLRNVHGIIAAWLFIMTHFNLTFMGVSSCPKTVSIPQQLALLSLTLHTQRSNRHV